MSLPPNVIFLMSLPSVVINCSAVVCSSEPNNASSDGVTLVAFQSIYPSWSFVIITSHFDIVSPRVELPARFELASGG